MITNFSDKDLLNYAGWATVKAAKLEEQVFQKITVKDWLVSGVQKEGRKSIRTVVKLVEGELLPECTCLDFCRSSKFCVHAVSLLFQSREVINDKGVVKNDSHIGDFDIRISLIKSLSEALKEGAPEVLVKVEAGKGNKSHLALSLMNIPAELGEYRITLTREKFWKILSFNTRVPIIEGVMGSSSPLFFPVDYRLESDSLSMHCPQAGEWNFLKSQDQFLLHQEKSYYILPAGGKLVEELLTGSTQVINIQELLIKIGSLSDWFDLASVNEAIMQKVSVSTPQFHLHIEGTVKEISATIEAHYGEVKKVVLSDNALQCLGSEAGRINVNNIGAEADALRTLINAGFSLEEEGYELHGECEVLELLAYTIPRVKEHGWMVTMVGSFRALAIKVVNLGLLLKIDRNSGKKGHVAVNFTFETPEGQGMKSCDAQRLISAGRQSFKLKDGKVALISKQEFSLISEALQDCESRQENGMYQVSEQHLQYLLDLGVKTQGESTPQHPLIDNKEMECGGVYRKLRPYQKDGVQWLSHCLRNNGYALLADDMGLGKTIQSCAIIERFSLGQETLIICPASLTSNWKSEIMTWLGSDSKISILSYQKYLADADTYQNKEVSLCIIDEASMIKNYKTKVAQALHKQPAKYRLALTGTPLENTPIDLWSIFQFLDSGYLGELKMFNTRFVKPLMTKGLETTDFASQLVAKRLRAKLKSRMIRRTKQEVLTELPPKTIRIERCPISNEQLITIEKIKADYEKQKSCNQPLVKSQILTTILRLRQAANDPALINDNFTQYSRKTQRLIEILDQAKTLNKKVLVFSQFSKMLEILKVQLEENGHSCSLLTGSTLDRDSQIDSFRRTNQVFLISLKAGGYGLNLTEASLVVHYEPWWNPAVENQATDRAYRIGQSEPITVIKLISDGTIDQRIFDLQHEKQNLSGLAFDTNSFLPNDLEQHSLESLI